MLDDLADYIVHDFVVGIQKIVAAHAGLARNPGGDDDNGRFRGVGVVVGAENRRVAFLDRHGFEQVEAFALRNAFNEDVDEDNVGFNLARSARCFVRTDALLIQLMGLEHGRYGAGGNTKLWRRGAAG